MAGRSLYFVAVTPQDSFSLAIRAFQQEMCDLFDVCRALRTLPHLTLVPPFHAPAGDEELLKSALDKVQFTPFALGLSGFGRFGKRVIFIKPEISEPLHALQTRTSEAFSPWRRLEKGRPFNPHFTIGYRDLEPVFRSAWPHFRDRPVPRQAVIEKIVLFRHDGRRWRVCYDIF